MTYARHFRYVLLLGVVTVVLAGCSSGPASSSFGVLPAAPGAPAEPDVALLRPALQRPSRDPRPTRFADPLGRATAALRPLTAPACTPITVAFQTDQDQGAPKPVKLTAAVVDPPSLEKTDIDATGCDVGVFLDANSVGTKLFYVQIHDASQIGVLAFGAQDVVLNRVTITNTGNHDCNGFKPNAVQTGVGIDFEGASGKINQSQISYYQKNGTAFNYGSTVAINNTVATGLGQTNSIPQDGIEWYKSTVKGVAGNVATDNIYDNSKDTLRNATGTGFRVLCTNIKDKPTGRPVLGFERHNVAVSDDIPFYISDNTTNGDCPPTYVP